MTPTPRLVTTIDVTRWNIDNPTIGKVFNDGAKTFQVDMAQQLSSYLAVRVLLIDNPTVPFLLLLIIGDLHPDKLDRSSLKLSIHDQLHRLSLPFRLFLEKMQGLSSQGVSWSPHVASITWAGVTVSDDRLARIHNGLFQLQQLRIAGKGSTEEQGKVGNQILQDTPLDLAGSAIQVTSHILAFTNFHIVLSETGHFGLSSRSVALLYLTTDRGLLHTYPDWREVFIPQFPMRVDWTPVFAESLLAWLLALNIWAINRQQLVASNLDQRAMTLRQSPDLRAADDQIRTTLSEVSLLGSDTAVASGEVNLLKRRSDSLLNQLLKGGPLGVEIALRIRDRTASQFIPEQGNGIVSRLASATLDSLQATAEHLRQVETEVANFQRHISDIASLQAREASSRLEKSIARLTIILVALTVALVAISLVDKLPGSLELLPWLILGVIALSFTIFYGIRWATHRRARRSARENPLGLTK